MTSIDDLTEALNHLVEQPDYPQLKQAVQSLADTRTGRFGGDHYPLNSLLEYARERGGAEWLGPLWAVTDKSRDVPAATPAPETAPTSGFDRRAYQTAYMRAFRDRERKACALRFRLYSPELRKTMPRGLVGEARREFLKHVRAVWQQRKQDLLDGVTYPAERNDLTAQFYEELDSQLQAGLAGDLDAARHVLGIAP